MPAELPSATPSFPTDSFPPDSLPTSSLPTLSAEELHQYLLRAFRLGNGARYRFAIGLCAMEESRLYFKLNYPSVQAYAAEEFKLGRTQIAEHGAFPPRSPRGDGGD